MIEVRQLQKSFRGHAVLENVSFRIERGESVVIVGRSGGGKSVLLKHLIGLLKPDAGKVLIEDEDVVPMGEAGAHQVGEKFWILFQGSALFDSMTVAENIGFVFHKDRKMPEAEMKHKISEVLEMVDLPGTEDKNPSELSGG